MPRSFLPERGERGIIIGQTGSGKTAFSVWMLARIREAPIIIYDTKIEPKFDNLIPNRVVSSIEEMPEALEDETIDYIIVRPPEEVLGDPRQLDEFLWWHYLHAKDVPAFIDEAVTFQVNSRAKRGLLSLMQRGRSKGITTIMCTQRPRGIDRSLLTEASKAYVFFIADMDDKKRINDVIPNFSKLPNPVKHGFYFYLSGDEHAELYRPIKLDAGMNTGYVDTSESSEGGGQTDEKVNDHIKHIWL